jgi:hypothetical protein
VPPDRRSGRPVYHIRHVDEIRNSSCLSPPDRIDLNGTVQC